MCIRDSFKTGDVVVFSRTRRCSLWRPMTMRCSNQMNTWRQWARHSPARQPWKRAMLGGKTPTHTLAPISKTHTPLSVCLSVCLTVLGSLSLSQTERETEVFEGLPLQWLVIWYQFYTPIKLHPVLPTACERAPILFFSFFPSPSPLLFFIR